MVGMGVLVAVTTENSLVKVVKNAGHASTAMSIDTSVRAFTVIGWLLLHVILLFVYFNPSVMRKRWADCEIAY